MTGRLLRPRLGVVGGLGPLATADFYRKTIDAVPAENDADHISMAILSVPQIPDRSGAIREGSDKPLPWLIEAIDIAKGSGRPRFRVSEAALAAFLRAAAVRSLSDSATEVA